MVSSQTQAQQVVKDFQGISSENNNPLLVKEIPAAAALKPLAAALAVLAITGGSLLSPTVQAQARPFSGSWMAGKGAATGQHGANRLPGGSTAARQQQQARQKLNRSVENLGSAAAAIAAQQAAQSAARNTAQSAASVLDGLTEGGLKVDATRPLSEAWINANAPVQTQNGERTNVAIEQTGDKAILNWETFNVGRNTTVDFKQQANWAALNRVNDPNSRPSQIQGQIKGDGTVMIANANGVVFSGSSQVNVRNLVAAAANISDDQFRDHGLYGANNAATFTNANGKIEVQRGAQITTHVPTSATQGGGYALLLGSDIHNDGQITTASGQTTLAAGDNFFIRKGVGTEGNKQSTTRGNEVAAHLKTDSLSSGKVLNTGLITAATGDITLTGHDVTQAGVAVATTSTAIRGTIHLLNSASDSDGRVTLAQGSTTAIVLDESITSGLDSQRDAALQALDGGSLSGSHNLMATGNFDNLSTAWDRSDLSRIEIVSGNTAEFQGDSLTLATGGQIVVAAKKRTLIDTGATLDVSGAVGVRIAMESNNLNINVQGNEQRDAPINRDSGTLNSNDLWIDRRTLVHVAAGTNGYESDRWYTAGGLLEVSGYLGTQGHSTGEWMAQGGTIMATGGELITRAGSSINLSGGTLDVQSGYLQQTWLRGADGRLYEASRAPGDLLYEGLYRGYEDKHVRWGETATRTFYNPLIGPRQRFEQGYTVGRDAGRFIVSTANAVLEGDIISDVYQGARQTEKANAALADGYYQSQNAVARRGQLWVGRFTPVYDKNTGRLRYGEATSALKDVILGQVDNIADVLTLDEVLPEERQNSLYLDADTLSSMNLDEFKILAQDSIQVQGALMVNHGGHIGLHAGAVDVMADLTAHSGSISLGNIVQGYASNLGFHDAAISASDGLDAESVTVHDNVVLNAAGLWANLNLNPDHAAVQPFINGGNIAIRSRGAVTLNAGSLIDVTSGAAMIQQGRLIGGKGGNVTLAAGEQSTRPSMLTLNGDIQGYGVNGGGELHIASGMAVGIGSGFLTEEGVLKAGETLKLGLTLLEDIELGLGGVLPTTYRYESNRIKAGEPVLAQLATDFGGPITLLADWNIPLDTGEPGRAWLWGYVITAKDPSGKEQSFRPFAGSQADPNVVIPKGWTLVSINNGGFPLDGSYVLPVGVFPTEGIETYNTYTKSLTAGTVLTAELLQEMDSTKVVISAGSPLNPGTQLNRDVRVGAFTQLDPALFQRGFSSYSVAGAQGLSVASNTHLAVEMPVLRPETGAFSLVNKADALSLWTPSLYVENPGSRQLSQRRGASLTLHAGAEPSYAGVFAKPGNVTALIDSNATVSVDPGQSIAIGSIGQLTVAGHLQAKGGNISLTELYANPSAVSGGEPHARSILISGELDVSGGSAVSKQVLPSEVLPYGLVYAAGSIVVGGTIDEEQGDVIAPHLFVEITDSAHLDASGAAAEFAMPGAKLDRHYSQGGAISITSNNGVALDGQLSLHAGGGTAAAGALAVGLGSPAYENVIATVLAPREMMLYQSAEDKPQTVAGAYGVAHLAADDLMATGADTIALFSDGLISFDTQDMLNLQARQSVRLYANSLALTENAASDARINISAPYVRLAGAVGPSPGSYGNSYRKALVDGGRSSRSDDVSAHFMVNANLIDLRDYLTFGTNSLVDRNQIDRRGFELVSLNSDGDIRFLKGLRTPVGSTSTQIQTPKSLTLSAQQIYPGTNAVANVIAGFGWEGREVGSSSYALFDPDSILTIKRPDSVLNSELPAMPLSVFGSLTLGAATVKQQGVIRAPLGTIGLGMASAAGGRTRQLNLHPGSLTSVSAQGLIMPYGGTADGIAYNYNGAPVFLQGAANSLNSGVLLTSGLIDVQQGAVLDLSGGGELTGAGFVSGRGGSTDARFHPLMQIGADGTLITPLAGLDSNPVYAIVPGISAYAPLDGEAGASAPLVGQTITVPDGVPGLKAGTYSLLPSTYALLPGAFRVELNGNNAYPQGASPMAMHNGSWIAGASLGIAHTPVSDALPRSVILTSADVLRSYSQYNETSYAEFVLADAARQGIGRGALPADGKSLHLIFNPQAADVATQQAFKYAGTALFNADQGGYGGALLIRQTSDTRSEQRTVEILPGTQMETGHDFNGLSLHAADLNAVKAHGLIIGGALRNDYGQGGNYITIGSTSGGSSPSNIVIRSGAILQSPEVFLITAERSGGGISIEAGGGINTLGQGAVAFDSLDGYVYRTNEMDVLAVSNGWLDMQAPAAPTTAPVGKIDIGACTLSIDCIRSAELYSEGTIAIATNKQIELAESARYGTRNLSLAVGGVNIGTQEVLAAAQLRGVLPTGLTLNQDVLNRLLQGDQQYGAPALESLILTARNGLNFFETATLSTLGADGVSSLQNLVLNTPAIFGYGAADDVALIQTGNLIWNGTDVAPPAPLVTGPGTGSGIFKVQADTIEFGYADRTQPDPLVEHDRLMLGFAQVDLTARERVTSNHTGSLSVYQSRDEHVVGEGFAYQGGNLSIHSPLISSEAAAILAITAGGDVVLDGGLTGAQRPGSDVLGGTLAITGRNLFVDTAMVLPSGSLSLTAQDDLQLGDLAYLDVSGRTVPMFDQTQYSWGGEVSLDSLGGSIIQSAGSTIDLSAQNNVAGRLTAIALSDEDVDAGTVALQGQILGGASGDYDAGGTWVPYLGAGIDLRAQRLGSGALTTLFAELNSRLNAGEVFGARSFQFKTGSLTIGNELKANQVNVSIDNGSLTVAGRIDASGERVGTIRLAGKQGLTLGNNAVLDASGTLLRVDSYGKIIDSPNRAIVELNSGLGTLQLAHGASINLSHGTDDARVRAGTVQHDGAALGTLELNAPRLGSSGSSTDTDAATYGDMAIQVDPGVVVQGAKSIAVQAVQRYDDAPDGAAGQYVNGDDYQVIDQAYLQDKHGDSTAFIDNALVNSQLLNTRLAGLNNNSYRDVLHLRPGVEIVSKTPEGHLVVQGDLDLSGFRYNSLNPAIKAAYVANSQPGSAAYGSGEPGALSLRAGGHLDIYGSVTDGFVPVDTTVDTDGWVLVEGVQPFGGDVVVPRYDIELLAGTTLPQGSTLNYDLPSGLLDNLTLPAGTVLPVDITLVDGSTIAAGTTLATPATVSNLHWPQGVPLPVVVTLKQTLMLKLGALIPANSKLKLKPAAGELVVPLNNNGRKNWAVASMLPAGAQSWSMRLVAGADTTAADTRVLQPYAQGRVVLADTHYSLEEIWTGGTDGTGMVWAPGGMGEVGTPVSEADLWWCDMGMCMPAPKQYQWVWAPGGMGEVGAPVSEADLWWCDMGMCEQKEVSPEPELTAVNTMAQGFSVIRTGTGDLDFIAADDIIMRSPYGVYTAGTDSPREGQFAGNEFYRPRGQASDDGSLLGSQGGDYEALAQSLYQAYYPQSGGNVKIAAGGDLIGKVQGAALGNAGSAAVGNWLWRQGTGSGSDADYVPAAWWINFGAYTIDPYESTAANKFPQMTGFTGIGALGGGNVYIDVAGQAGEGSALSTTSFDSNALVIAVGSAGRVLSDGSMALTGGGDVTMRVGGALNALNKQAINTSNLNSLRPRHDLQGALINLRGHLSLSASALGAVVPLYGFEQDSAEVRAYDPYGYTKTNAMGGLVLVPGDSTFSLASQGDLVLGGVGDPGRVALRNATPFTIDGAPFQGGLSSFSLWTDHTAINLFSAGGDLTPGTQIAETSSTGSGLFMGRDYSATDGRFVYPSRLSVVAATGRIFLGESALGSSPQQNYPEYSLLLAPHSQGEGSLSVLAGDSIYGGRYVINRSGAVMSATSSPFNPAFLGTSSGTKVETTNYAEEGIGRGYENMTFPLFVFGSGSNAGTAVNVSDPGRFYAVGGDIVGLMTGQEIVFGGLTVRPDARWYEAAGAVYLKAGGDIVGSGNLLGSTTAVPAVVGNVLFGDSIATGNLIVHSNETDVSLVQAGGDIIYSSFTIAGPGTLEITAGGDIRMDDQASVTSVGPVQASDLRPGASIVMQAGLEPTLMAQNFNDFVNLYVNPDNQATKNEGDSLAGQPGKVVHTYQQELVDWMADRYGFGGSAEEALAVFSTLTPEQQRIFARQIYFAELRAGGREYNDADGPRFGSYLRGRNAIAALFPANSTSGTPNVYQGDITLYGGSGIHTRMGGDIQTLTPGGRQLFGVEGVAPPSTAGVITQGFGHIQMYTLGSILLGQSRIMTTAGGDILAWAAQGDINAGRGSKTTLVYTPPRRVYDQWGNLMLSSDVPSTGAGLATLDEGDMDLIAPEGTIDAGEAGIRVSGNVNIAALHVVNAANIQVQGDAVGIPVAAVVNTGALASASSASSAAATAAQETVQRVRNEARQNQPSIFSVQILGFGGESIGLD